VGNVPLTVGFNKACELHLLAKNFLVLDKMYQKQKIIKEIVSEELNWDFIEKEVEKRLKTR
jgi:hypothetical protein